jgi:hypothetical protein
LRKAGVVSGERRTRLRRGYLVGVYGGSVLGKEWVLVGVMQLEEFGWIHVLGVEVGCLKVDSVSWRIVLSLLSVRAALV